MRLLAFVRFVCEVATFSIHWMRANAGSHECAPAGSQYRQAELAHVIGAAGIDVGQLEGDFKKVVTETAMVRKELDQCKGMAEEIKKAYGEVGRWCIGVRVLRAIWV